MPFLTFQINCPDAETADRIADELVARRLVAVATRHPPTQSTFRWKGRIRHADQYPLTLKTRQEHADLIEAEIRRMHPYEIPPITRVVTEASSEYLTWIREEASGGE
ncbi:divalent-cation tolerance protein CutA [Tropicimonas sp. IMCC6043]|uniref:divalent-cation tolerance protein CutA n=1 Tax=Tropicimonas sp. IMCC6043 TaxID=2510645 RepID=UPI0013EA0F2F|nr:divalent-cation tolerance protein CutA [Tropicimonas sp. IMCC6043]